MYDVAIIGGGPAGATLARRIGRTQKVLLIDRRDLTNPEPQGVGKCCGGLLAPDAQKMLARQGLALPQHVMVGPQLFVVRTVDLPARMEQYYQRFYINLDRERFDRWLVSLIPENVEIRTGCLLKRFHEETDRVKIVLSQHGKEYVEYAKVLVGADGGFSQVRKQAFPARPTPKTYISIQEWFEADRMVPYFSAIFDREVTDFYSWTIPKEKILIIGAALEPGQDAVRKFDLLKQKLREYGFQWGKMVHREGAWILRPVKRNQICVGAGRVALIGEAAGWISPSSAEGFSYAFRSAELLADCLQEGAVDLCESYARSARGLSQNILLKNLKSPFMYNDLLRKLALQSGLQSVEVQQE